MASSDDAPSFGAELKDAFKPVNTWVSNGIAWLDDIQQFYRERSTIEKEHSAKLNALAKRYYEKKAKKSSSLSVGDTPSLTPGSLESASLTIWSAQLTTLESRAAEHERLSNEFVTNVAEPLKQLSGRYEEIRKRHVDYAAKLEKERDAGYTDLKKMKGSYDSVCQEVENRRKKVDSAFDYSKQKAQSAFQQHTLTMNNVKNSYLIHINVTNKQKEKYYHDYLPQLLDSLQDLSETRTTKLNALWSAAAQLESACLTRCLDHVKVLSSEIPRNDPPLDSLMFIRHNSAPWQEPAEFAFEPSPVWHDDSSMVIDDNAKVYLRNLMGKSKSQLSELRREVAKKQKEIDNLERTRQSIRKGQDKRDEVEVVTAIFSLREELHRLDHQRLTAEVETSSIQSVVGDLTIGAKNHNFKSQTFKIPTNCDLCGDRIWGLAAKGFDCRECGYTCHSKCEMTVPAACPGEQSKEERKKLKAERQEAARALHPVSNGGPPDGVAEMPTLSRNDTMSTLSSGYAASAHRSVSGSGARTPTDDSGDAASDESPKPPVSKPAASKPGALRKNRVVAPPPTQYISELPAGDVGGLSKSLSPATEARGKMQFAYQASGEGEISVDEGHKVTIVEADDGSGWIKVRAGTLEGLVPASYVESLPAGRGSTERPSSTYSNSSASVAGGAGPGGKKKGPAVAPKRGAKKLKYVEALYDYEARSEAEWNMSEGERFVLVSQDAGDGWADVEKGGTVKSVPANYIQDVP
ncbi:MAG: hypothetical protein M1838_005554 [Thelocarpon superellum]|nr:MAG: hypothetical protein M1838_005554 [Thelocarpon superellum]